jgi:hypothetical protein
MFVPPQAVVLIHFYTAAGMGKTRKRLANRSEIVFNGSALQKNHFQFPFRRFVCIPTQLN